MRRPLSNHAAGSLVGKTFIASALGAVALVAALPSAGAASGQPRSAAPVAAASVIVRELPNAGDGPEQLVRRLGGTVGQHIAIIDGFVARVPSGSLAQLRSAPGIRSVTVDRKVRLLGAGDGFDAKRDAGSIYSVAQVALRADEMWKEGITGKGVDVALIDSGVVPVNGLRTPGKVIDGADLSFESQAPNLRYLDTFGHGTHMAGIIAGRDDAVKTPAKGDYSDFLGVAPDARLVSVKVAEAHGATDVSQVIAAIDWVVQHRRDNGMNIRVLNLSFGTDGEQDYRVDPLAFAAEVAWRNGIVVVAAAGNGGFGSSTLNDPAYDPFVIAVGGADSNGTPGVGDDSVESWSSRGSAERGPDLVAPGKSVASLRAPGSEIDLSYPGARVGERLFRGSGTSQAAAAVSGAAALVIQQHPGISPDQVKALLKKSAARLPHADRIAQGAGMVDLKKASDAATPAATQSWQRSTGTGSLELARGSSHLSWNGVELRGEIDIFGAPWDSARWASESLAGTSWSGGTWNGNVWSGNAWSGNAWSGNAWSGNAWSGNAWSGNAWSGNAWSGNVWSGNAWSGNIWSGNAWSGNAWSGNVWSAHGWGD